MAACNPRPPWAQGRAALVYRGRARKLVLALKHGDRQDIAPPAARWMARQSRGLVAQTAIVVPVPLHLTRQIRRRYNQSALLARCLADALGLDWSPDALHRVRATPSLEGSTRDDRFATLADAIAPARPALLAGRDVLLVDDVMTSGATLSAATEACHAAGAARVCVSVLARAARDA